MNFKMYGAKNSVHPNLPKIRHVIGIAAGKGGVGKSSLTVNLALALRVLGYKVGVLDADLYGPSLRKMMPEDRMPVQKGQQIQPALADGIELISMAFFRDQGQASVVRAPIANGLITQFLTQVAWSELDYLLIDFPPGTGDIQITLSQHAHLKGALIITTPQEVALLDVRKCISMFDQVQIPIVGIVENMSYYQPQGGEKVYLFGRGGGEKLAREKGVPFLGTIPVDPLISQSMDQGCSLFRSQDSLAKPLQDCFLHLAQELHAHCEMLTQELDKGMGAFELEWRQM